MTVDCPRKESWPYEPPIRPERAAGCGDPRHFPPAGTVLPSGDAWACPACGTAIAFDGAALGEDTE